MLHRSSRSSLAVQFLARFVVAGLSVVSLTCGAAQGQATPAIKSVGDVKSMLVATLPADAKEIGDALVATKIGDTITVRGYIPNNEDAFHADSAQFTLTPPVSSQASTDKPSPTPSTTMRTVTVRIANAKGETLKGPLNGQHGLKKGSEAFVTGIIETMVENRMTLRATAMHIPRSPLPPSLFSLAKIENATDITEARKAGGIKVGDEVVLRGRIGGAKAPFVAGRAIFTLIGRGLKACNENPDDHCAMPWDYCCETREAILANTVTVQVTDEKAQVLRTDMKGRQGLKELSEIVVVGKVAVADGKAVVVNATKMYVTR